nr:HPP family protein [Paracoccus sp. (in: a-proteobacteria)]
MKISIPSLHAFGPVLPSASPHELLRAGLGSVLGIGLCALLTLAMPEVLGLPLMLMAPLGASAVLIFADPNAPLAQPWSAVVGNTVSALITVLALQYLPWAWTPALVVGAAILGMLALRALHPPGGAVALLTALDPEPALALGPAYALAPVGVMTVVLVAAGILYNSMSGRRYPFRQPKETETAGARSSLPLSGEELASLLQRFNQAPNIGVADLGRILAAAEAEVGNHRFDAVTCAEIMTPDLITVAPDAPIA